MVRHNNVASYIMVSCFQMVEPFIHDVIAPGNLEQRYPFITGEGDIV